MTASVTAKFKNF